MEIYAAFIRAINVGGTGKISKAELLEICDQCGFENAKTYIQSGNLIFKSNSGLDEIKEQIEAALLVRLGKKHETYIRKMTDLENILQSNPFPNCAPNRVLVSFHDTQIENIELGLKNQKTEEIESIGRETFIHFGEGVGNSKLIIPALKNSTARNINTIEKVLEIAKAML